MALTYDLITPRLRLYAPSLADIELLRQGQREQFKARIHVTGTGPSGGTTTSGGTGSSDIFETWWNGTNLVRLLPRLVEDMREQLASDDGPKDIRWVWLIIDPTSNNIIGDLGFHNPLSTGPTAEIGYCVIPPVRGHGYVPEAARVVIEWAFSHANITTVIAQIDPRNTASLRVAAKLGMHEVAPLSEHYRCFALERAST